jgi:hypothetical protein
MQPTKPYSFQTNTSTEHIFTIALYMMQDRESIQKHTNHLSEKEATAG